MKIFKTVVNTDSLISALASPSMGVRFSLVGAFLMLVACGGGVNSSKDSVVAPSDTNALQQEYHLVANVAAVVVPEGSTASFSVKLSSSPGMQIQDVFIGRVSGDEDINILSGATSSFSDQNWSVEQSVMITALQDSDSESGVAVLRLSSPGLPDVDVTVIEIDDDVQSSGVQPVTNVSSVSMSEGTTSSFGVSLAGNPVTPVTVNALAVKGASDISIVQGNSLTFDASNWRAQQIVTLAALQDVDLCDDKAEIQLVATTGGQVTVLVRINDDDVAQNAGINVCGTITAPESALIDSDVNDDNAPYASNDAVEFAQVLANPATVGGYVNVPNSGSPGRSFVDGDVSDFYTARVLQNQLITLFIANPDSADLNLYLWNDAGQMVNASISTTATESFSIPSAGDYFIEVRACQAPETCVAEGGSNYVLSVGQSTGVAQTNTLRLSDDFVPGDVIVRFSENVATTRALKSPADSVSSLGLVSKAGNSKRSMLFELNSTTMRVRTASALNKVTSNGLTLRFKSAEQQRKYDTLQAVKALRLRDDVAFSDPNYLHHPLAVPNDPLYVSQWHYPQINLPGAWNLTTGSNAVIVGVIDTGVMLNHPDIQGQLVAGYDFISDLNNALDGDGIDPNPDDPGDQAPGGSSFHGTHVSGTIAAATDNGIGVAGIAWRSKIMPLRALGKFGGNDFDILQAIRYAAGLSNDSGTVPARPVDIINMSFGGARFSQTVQAIITEARNAGVIIIAAAGNSGVSELLYPASYDGVTSVSAVNISKALASYSSFGASVDVAAPGGDISTDMNGDGVADGVLSTGGSDRSGSIILRYPIYDGTSMAAPHIAGVAALMKSVNPGLTPLDFDNLLASGKITADLGSTGRDDLFGNGLIDALKAVSEAAALGGGGAPPPQPPNLTVLPTPLSFGARLTSQILTLGNGGGDGLVIDSVVANQSWLSIRSQNINPQGLGDYLVQVDRRDLSDNSYNAEITIISNAQTLTVPVLMEVRAVAVNGDAGLHYVILVDPATHQELARTTVLATNGVYEFSFSNVASGTYHLLAGTDSNKDGTFCDLGEACGAYNTLSQMTPLIVTNEDVSALDFSTGFVFNFTGLPIQ